MSESLTIEVRGCARCGGEHRLEFKKLERPFTPGPSTVPYEFWAMCPRNLEPVLMRRTRREGSQP